jgi:tRNA-splicing endonuclease subunit Sen34
VDDTTAVGEPSSAELAEWDEARKQQVSKEIALWHEREIARTALEITTGKGKGRLSEEAVQKRKERQERRAREVPPELTLDGEDAPKEITPDAQAEAHSQPNYTVHIPSTSLSHAWYCPSIYDDLHSASHAGLWTYPRTPEEVASCRVFRDLWEKGHFLGSGLKFGGDFLVYPGWSFAFL